MAKYQYLDSDGLKKYHEVSGYSSLPLEYHSGKLNADSGAEEAAGDPGLTGVEDYVTDLIELDNTRTYTAVVAAAEGNGVICYYSDGTFFSSATFTGSVSFKLSDINKEPTIGHPNQIRVYGRINTNIIPRDFDTPYISIKANHDNMTRYVYDLIEANKINIEKNTSLITKIHASHDMSVGGANPFEKGVTNNVSVTDLYLKLDTDYLAPDSAAITYGASGTENSIDSATIAKFLNEANSGSFSTTITNSASFKYTLTLAGKSFTGTRLFNAYYPMYFGSSDSDTISADNMNTIFTTCTTTNAMTDVGGVGSFAKKSISSSPAGSHSVEVKQGYYMYLAVPNGMTIKKVTSSGYDVPMESVVTVSGTNKESYNIYRSSSKFNAGTVNIVIS